MLHLVLGKLRVTTSSKATWVRFLVEPKNLYCMICHHFSETPSYFHLMTIPYRKFAAVIYNFKQTATQAKSRPGQKYATSLLERMTNIDTFTESMCITGYQALNYFYCHCLCVSMIVSLSNPQMVARSFYNLAKPHNPSRSLKVSSWGSYCCEISR